MGCPRPSRQSLFGGAIPPAQSSSTEKVYAKWNLPQGTTVKDFGPASKVTVTTDGQQQGRDANRQR